MRYTAPKAHVAKGCIMTTEKFQFPGSDGQMLAASLDLPDGTPVAYALFAHCFTCGQNVLAAKRIAEGLAKHGIATLRFDFTGIGASEANSPTRHSHRTSAISCWRQTICAKHGKRRQS
jgi:predicted alpha/beta hydrolase